MNCAPKMEFDIVLATRNRASILPISIRLMLSQERLPVRFIVADASDNHSEVKTIVESIFREAAVPTELIVLRSEISGSSYQRNLGLKHVKSPIVFFPDDDVLWYPGTAEQVMKIYERDVEGVVGCVAPAVAPTYPPGVFDSSRPVYEMEWRDRFSRKLRSIIGPIEQRLFPDPINSDSMWRTIWGAKIPPVWLREEDAELCGPVFGYRLSFRTEAIRKLEGFDEHLGRYAMFEDSDASLGSLREFMNVCARRARVFHYRVPGERVPGWEFGMMAMLNRIYVACKHAPPGPMVRRPLKRYLYYKVFRYVLQAHTQYGRDRLRGALYGLSNAQQLIDAPTDQLLDRYLKLRHT